jgi:hypothetical protein
MEMKLTHFSIIWLVGVPLIAFCVSHPRQVDTSEVTASKIREGMRFDQAQEIIDGPPGDYGVRFTFRFTSGYSGGERPLCSYWKSPKGEIMIVHGRECMNRGDERRCWVEDSGTVNRISWRPVPEEEVEKDDPEARLIVCFAVSMLIYFVGWLSRRLLRAFRPPSSAELNRQPIWQ